VDNVKAAKEQQDELRAFINKTHSLFRPIPRIPDAAKITDANFSAGLSVTIDQLQHAATNSSVSLPVKYGFSFEAERNRVSFAGGSLDPLSVQLGEIKAICDVLFDSKINSLDGVRRERVSADDASGPAADYTEEKSVTNDLAVLTPYEMTFRCFTPELAAVLAGFGSSPYGLIVKTVDVESSPAVATTEEGASPGAVMPQPVPYTPPPQIPPRSRGGDGEAAFNDRYGIRPNRPVVPQAPQPVTPTPGAAPTKGGLPTVLDERQLKVTVLLNIVKLLPAPK
jgi:hypothetical protein